jgi:hypothetical protein
VSLCRCVGSDVLVIMIIKVPSIYQAASCSQQCGIWCYFPVGENVRKILGTRKILFIVAHDLWHIVTGANPKITTQRLALIA